MKHSLPFPRLCPNCCKQTVQRATIEHMAEVKYESKKYRIEVPDLRVGRCDACGEILLDIESDEQIDVAFRRQVGLLTAEQIRAGRKRLGLKQDELAHALSVAKATVNRWEKRRLVPSRAMDKLLRAYFQDPGFRILLERIGSDPSIGVVAQGGHTSRADPPRPSPRRQGPEAQAGGSVNRIKRFLYEPNKGESDFLAVLVSQKSCLIL